MHRCYAYCKKNLYIPIYIALLLLLSFFVGDIRDLWSGFLEILESPSLLITDYLKVGRLNSTLLNAGLTLLLNFLFVKKLKMRISGPIYAGLMLILGFSFFGKNAINFIPLYLGIYLYSKFKKIEYRNLIINLLFSTGIAPVVSFLMFGISIPLYWSVPLALVVGIGIGFIIPAISSHVIIFHSGYNLYNVGFTMGLISVVLYGILKSFGIAVDPVYLVENQYHKSIWITLLIFALFHIVLAFLHSRNVFSEYRSMYKRSGRLLMDYVRDYGIDPVLLNIGINTLFCLLVVFILKIPMNGPMVAAILCVSGFSAMGKHLKNILPVMIGAVLAIYFSKNSFDNVGMQIGIFFVTGLAPISGRYHFLIGVLAGFIHIMILPLVSSFQGGFDLYNNGLAAGFVAAIFISVIESFEQEIKYDRKREQEDQ